MDTGTFVAEEVVETPNLRSALLHPEEVSQWLATEVARGHISVFAEPPHPFYRVCGVGLVPKPPAADGSLKWRFISDFSRPGAAGQEAVNDGIDLENWRLKMLSIWAVIDILAKFGPDAVWTAIDCEWGYRQIDIHPDLYHTQVYKWLGKFYVDHRLVFGSASSPAIYNAIMECVEWIVQDRVDVSLGEGMAKVRHYLDDFFLAGRNRKACKAATGIMLATFKELGIPLSHAKSQLNVVRGIYLGLLLRSHHQSLAMPDRKKHDIAERLRRVLDPEARSVPKKWMESLVGKLTWGHSQWFQSRPLINPLLRALAAQPLPFGKVKLTVGVRRAATAWLEVLSSTPPRTFAWRPSILLSQLRSAQLCWEEDADVFCGDAAAEHGFGWFNRIAVCTAEWSAEERSSASACKGDLSLPGEEPIKNSSTLQELRCMSSAVRFWRSTRPKQGAICTFLTDAKNLVFLAKKGRSSVRAINDELLQLNRELRTAGNALRVVWQSREEVLARAADTLSRGNIDAFKVCLPAHPAVVLDTGASRKAETVA